MPRDRISVKRLHGTRLATCGRGAPRSLRDRANAEVVRSGGDREVTPAEYRPGAARAQAAGRAHLASDRRAVITLRPTSTTLSARPQDAGRIAGLEVLRIVNEPTAARSPMAPEARQGLIAGLMTSGWHLRISYCGSRWRVRSVGDHGNTHLGGDTSTGHGAVAARRYPGSHAGSLDRPRTLQELRLGAGPPSAGCHQKSGGPHHSLRRFTYGAISPGPSSKAWSRRSWKHAWSLPNASRTRDRRPGQIDEIVLVGARLVCRSWNGACTLFGRRRKARSIRRVVALGAPFQAQILGAGSRTCCLLDVTPSAGIETLGGIVSVLIPRNNDGFPPWQGVLHTLVDGQTAVDMHCSGERELAQGQRSLSPLDLSGVEASRPMPNRVTVPHRCQRHPAGPVQGARTGRPLPSS